MKEMANVRGGVWCGGNWLKKRAERKHTKQTTKFQCRSFILLFNNAMHRFSPLPLIQFRCRQRIACCGNQVVIRGYRSAVSGAGKNVKHQTDSKCSTAIFSRALDFERFAGDARSNDLSTPWAAKIDDPTHSGAELVGSANVVHNRNFLACDGFGV